MVKSFKFVRELYSDDELKDLLEVYDRYNSAEMRLKKCILDIGSPPNYHDPDYSIAAFMFNKREHELREHIKLKCPRCEYVSNFDFFVDNYDNHYQNNVCYECSKLCSDVSKAFNDYFDQMMKSLLDRQIGMPPKKDGMAGKCHIGS